MRVATWNINGLRARLDFVKSWLQERQPDLVGLQELKLSDEKFPHADFEAVGYRAATHGQKAWNGVAILLREDAGLGELEIVQRGLPDWGELGARLLTAKLHDLSFTTVYCPNGKSIEHEDFPKKLAWFDALASHFEKGFDPEEPAVLCGDFNIVPAAIDGFDEAGSAGTCHHTDAERTRLRRLLDWGLRDVFREKYPDTQAFSWWDYRGGAFHRRQGLRIDLLLATAPLLERVDAVEIDREWRKKKDGLTASDHAPVFADLR